MDEDDELSVRNRTALKGTFVLSCMSMALLASFWAMMLIGGCLKMNAIIIISTFAVFAGLGHIYWKTTLRIRRTVKITVLVYSIGLVILADMFAKHFVTGLGITYYDWHLTICVLFQQFVPTYIALYANHGYLI